MSACKLTEKIGFYKNIQRFLLQNHHQNLFCISNLTGSTKKNFLWKMWAGRQLDFVSKRLRLHLSLLITRNKRYYCNDAFMMKQMEANKKSDVISLEIINLGSVMDGGPVQSEQAVTAGMYFMPM